jgi:UDP-2-acetamido-3-amino-2,3-dideoxy-glucuronate N-acetyltransferase
MTANPTLALVGAGHWGKNLARNFNTLSALHSICETNDSLLHSYSPMYPHVNLTSDFSSVLANEAITKIAIAAPAAQHYSLAKQALLANKDVFVEKPLCLHPQEAEELISLAEKRGRILMVGHLLQYHPAIIKLQALVTNGELGKLQYIASHRLSLGQIRTEENNLWSFAPHDISVILSLGGNQMPLTVRCIGQDHLSKDIVDICITSIEFTNGLHAHVYSSWMHPFKEQKLVVIGTEGMAVFDDMLPWEEKLTLYRQPVRWSHGTQPQVNKSAGEKIALPLEEPLLTECLHFLTSCNERKLPKTDGKEGLRVLQVLEAAQLSLNDKGEKHSPQKRSRPYFAHPTAVVDATANVGAATKIWHFSHVMNNCHIGPQCNIGQNVVVSPDVTLGKNVKVQNNVSIYSGVICEDDVFLGPSMVFTNVINPRSAVNRRGEYQQTIVRQGATIGANATIVCGIELGNYCFIGAGAVVTKDVKPYALMVGNPAKQIGWMSRHGERLDLPVSAPAQEELRASCPVTGEMYVLRGEDLFLEVCSLTTTER